MELFYGKGACSMAPHIALCEAEANFKINSIPLDGTQKKQPYVDINPKGSVPALKTDSGEILTECAVILQYIGDQFPDKNLIPRSGTMERYRAQEWLNYIATEFHKGIGAFFGYARLANEQTKADMREASLTKLKWHFDIINKHFTNNHFVLGSQFSVADAYLFTTLNWCGGVKIDLTAYPSIQSYRDRVAGRAAVRTAMKEEGLI